jgi:hypothetical protein
LPLAAHQNARRSAAARKKKSAAVKKKRSAAVKKKSAARRKKHATRRRWWQLALLVQLVERLLVQLRLVSMIAPSVIAIDNEKKRSANGSAKRRSATNN